MRSSGHPFWFFLETGAVLIRLIAFLTTINEGFPGAGFKLRGYSKLLRL